MAARQPMPEAMAKAVDEICIATEEQGSRLWLDAEQQVLQKGLDDWALDTMQKHNKTETPIVYNTIQAYLKGSKANLSPPSYPGCPRGLDAGYQASARSVY